MLFAWAGLTNGDGTDAADAHSASARIRSELPGRGKEAEKEAEKYGAEAGAKIDQAVGPFASIIYSHHLLTYLT